MSHSSDLFKYTARQDRKIQVQFMDSPTFDTTNINAIDMHVFFVSYSNSSAADHNSSKEKQYNFCSKLNSLNSHVGNSITNLLNQSKFCANLGKIIVLRLIDQGSLMNIVICGLGQKNSAIDKAAIHKIGYAINDLRYQNLKIYIPSNISIKDQNTPCVNSNNYATDAIIADYLAYALEYCSYKFDKYTTTANKALSSANMCDCQYECGCGANNQCSDIQTKNKVEATCPQSDSDTCDQSYKYEIYFETKASALDAKKLFESNTQHINLGYKICMDLGNLAPNDLYPESFAQYIQDVFANIPNISIRVLDEVEMKKLGMNCLLGVGQGSARESRTVIIEYTGDADSKDYEAAMIGKGVCFDTGGISLKPGLGMDKMKHDMCGAAATVGALYAIAKRGDKVNLIGAVGLVENMPGGGAQRPGDIVTSMSGKTVEILNTDAEGRLVLIDVMEYVYSNFKPKAMITIATLTGAIGVALGNAYAGMFVNNEKLGQKLISYGEKEEEHLWHMPYHTTYLDQLKSKSGADIANIPTTNLGYAGSNTAAAFLRHFVKPNVLYAHLDIATVSSGSHRSRKTIGANGFGVGIFTALSFDLCKGVISPAAQDSTGNDKLKTNNNNVGGKKSK